MLVMVIRKMVFQLGFPRILQFQEEKGNLVRIFPVTICLRSMRRLQRGGKRRLMGWRRKGIDAKRGLKENKDHDEWHVEEGVRNIELEMELEKRKRRRGEGYKNKDRYHDDVKEGDERIVSTKSSHVKGIKHKDEEHEDRYRESRHKEDKGKENGERVSKSKDVNYIGEREKDDKYYEDSKKDDKYHVDSDRDGKQRDRKSKDVKYKGEREKDDKYYEDSKKDDKYHVDSDRDGKQRDKKYKESGGRVEKNGDNKYRDKNDRAREDSDREKRTRDHKNGDQVVRHRDYKDRSRDIDKDGGTDYRTRNIKDQNCESEKRSTSNDKVDSNSVNHNRHRSSPHGKPFRTRDHHRVSKQEESKSRDYNGNSNKDSTSAKGQSDKISSRSLENMTQKDDNNFSQLDNDNLSVSSPFKRNNRFSSNNKSFFPPQTPFRTQNNWQNFPNWPSPLPNSNYIPFPPIFNPFMHQYAPPIFHHPPIYHESVPPLLHNWGANFPISGSGSHGYGNGRVDRENSKIQSDNQVWEDTGVTVDMQSPVQKDEFLSKQTDIKVETMNYIPEIMKVKNEDDSLISSVYLSKIDISEDLTESDLYNQCTRMLDFDQEQVSDEFDCKILYLEEGIEGHVSDGDSLFDAINKSVFKKAMSLYTKQRARNQEKGGEDVDSGVKYSRGYGELSTSEKMDMDVDAGVKDSGHNCDGGKEVNMASDGGGSLLVVTTKPVMPEFIEFDSVNSSRIH